MRVMCEVGLSVRTKDTRGDSVWVGAPGGIRHRVGWGPGLGQRGPGWGCGGGEDPGAGDAELAGLGGGAARRGQHRGQRPAQRGHLCAAPAPGGNGASPGRAVRAAGTRTRAPHLGCGWISGAFHRDTAAYASLSPGEARESSWISLCGALPLLGKGPGPGAAGSQRRGCAPPSRQTSRHIAAPGGRRERGRGAPPPLLGTCPPAEGRPCREAGRAGWKDVKP